MIKTTWASIFIFVFISGYCPAQQLTPFVISTAGGFSSNGSAMLSSTTGELAAIETYTGGTTVLTQGFQQPWDLGTSLEDLPGIDFEFGVYPNPCDGDFYLLTDSELNLQFEVSVYDALGQPIGQTSFHQLAKKNIQPIYLSFAPPGIYVLSLRLKDTGTGRTQVITRKITIVK